MSLSEIEGSMQERRLYDLILKRTLASQMADAQLERTTVTINMDNDQENLFLAYGAQIKFDGFLKVYHESSDDESLEQDDERLLPPLSVGQEVTAKEITATERFTQHPPRYTGARILHRGRLQHDRRIRSGTARRCVRYTDLLREPHIQTRVRRC